MPQLDYSKQKHDNKRTRKEDTVSVVTETESKPDDVSLLAIQSTGNKTDFCIIVQQEVQGAKITMELDTGASLSRRVYRENFSKIILQRSYATLKIYNGEPLSMFNAEVNYEKQQHSLPLLVVKW